MSESKLCYAIIEKETGRLLVEDSKLPIYWNRRAAKERAALFPKYEIKKIQITYLMSVIKYK
jgi:hypothetical protein